MQRIIILDFVDIGGGFFGGLKTKPQFETYFEIVEANLSNRFSKKETVLIVEPGMALVGAFVRYVTSVIDVKDTSFNRFIITDGSRTNIDPLMNKSSYSFEINQSQLTPILKKQVVCGYTCMEHDRLFVAVDEPEISVGEQIVYNKVGAYTLCLTPLFISYFPDVYVETDHGYKLVRARWNANDYLNSSDR